MNYRTTCPHCTSVFRLGANQLDAAQGWVQCSVCGSAFDARLSLLLENGAPLPETGPPAEHEETARGAAGKTVAGAESHEPVSGAADQPVADLPHGIVQRDVAHDLPSIILIDPDIPVPEDLGPLPQIYPAPSIYPPEPVAPVKTPAPAMTAPAAPPTARIEYATPMPGAARIRFARRPVPAWIWGMASTLLTLMLLTQTTYFLRDTLVSRLPQTRPALEQACAMLGCTLSLPKNLSQLQIIGSDLQTETSGRLRLSLTLGNRARHAQAWPVLVLTLTDQRNRPLARRSFAPSEYLGDAQRIANGLPPRSEQALNLPLTVRNLAPMGFDLQLTY